VPDCLRATDDREKHGRSSGWLRAGGVSAPSKFDLPSGEVSLNDQCVVVFDEKGKIPLGRQGCSPNIAQRHWNPAREPHHLVGFTPEVR